MSIMEVHRGGNSEYRANVYSITVGLSAAGVHEHHGST